MNSRMVRSTLAMGALMVSAGAASADVVIDWNNVYIDTARAVGGPPCPLTRSVTAMHVAMFDALQGIQHQFAPLIANVSAPSTASKEAAISQAAHDVLVAMYPSRQAIYDEQLTTKLALVADGQPKTDGITVGAAAAAAILADRAADAPYANDTTYIYGTQPGAYQPTAPDFHTPPFTPGWGFVKPWCMLAHDQFRSPGGPLGHRFVKVLLRSPAYATALNEVQSVGRRFSTTRTADQTQFAWFWANDRNGTFKPAGHLNSITQVVSKNNNLTLEQNARLFAMINVAMADAGIIAWDAKYLTDIDLWRPITAIRNANLDANPQTTQDTSWRPLLDFTPPFPGYASGHSSFAGAWATTMAGFFGTDTMTFTVGTDEPIVQNVKRTFTSFSQAGMEDALSRVYLGVHFRFDCTDGYNNAAKMASFMVSNFFQPTCAADFNHDGVVNYLDLNAFLNAYFLKSASADFNHDGVVTAADAMAFMNAYLAGCSATTTP